MRPTPSPSAPLALVAVAALAAHAVPASLPAQDGGAEASAPVWLPDTTAFAPLVAAPREAGLLGSVVIAERDGPGPDFGGTRVEAEAALGWRRGIVLVQREGPGRPSVVVGFELGVASRFFLETAERDLIGVDYRVGAPVTLGYRGWEARVELRHSSSHLGDDFVHRFGITDLETSTRDGVELFVARRFAGAGRAYAGGAVNFHRNPGAEGRAASAGVEWDGSRGEEGDGAWPFWAVDARATDVTRGASVTGHVGVLFRVNGVKLALGLRGHAGPSPVVRLQDRDETFLGLGLRILP